MGRAFIPTLYMTSIVLDDLGYDGALIHNTSPPGG